MSANNFTNPNVRSQPRRHRPEAHKPVHGREEADVAQHEQRKPDEGLVVLVGEDRAERDVKLVEACKL